MIDTNAESTFVEDNLKARKSIRKNTKPVKLRSSHIQKYLQELVDADCSEETIKKYTQDVSRFYEFLGETKLIYPETLKQWKESMLQKGYAPRTINTSIVVVNGLYRFIDCSNWQYSDWVELEESKIPELTREEYQRLLKNAREQENVQLYLIVKILTCLDIAPRDIMLLTREAVDEGKISGKMYGTHKEILIPEFMRTELLNYAMQHGIKKGPLFVRKSGKCMDRMDVNRMVAKLGETVGLERGKATPRNLAKLRQNTMANIREQADRWVTDTYHQLLLEEEVETGWQVGLKKMT